MFSTAKSLQVLQSRGPLQLPDPTLQLPIPEVDLIANAADLRLQTNVHRIEAAI